MIRSLVIWMYDTSQAHLVQYLAKARFVAQACRERMDFQEEEVPIMFRGGAFQQIEGILLASEGGVNPGDGGG